MKKILEITRIKHGILLIAFVGALLVSIVGGGTVSSAGSATITLTPSSGTYTTGSKIVVTVTFNGNDMAGGQADLGYDQSKLKYEGVDVNGSAFAQGYVASGGNGSVSIARTTQGTTLSGSRVLGKVTFTMLASSGTASVTVKDSSGIYDSNVADIWNHVAATATFTAAAASSGGGGRGGNSSGGGSSSGGSNSGGNSGGSSKPSPSTPGGSGGSSGSGGGGTPATPASGLSISSPAHSNVEFNRATISGVLSKPAVVKVKYSMTADGKTIDMLSPEINANGNFSLRLDPSTLVPGTTYAYQIIASDGTSEVVTEPQTFTTLGYTVKLLVKDKSGKIAKNTNVTLYSEPQTVKSDKDGVAVFQNVSPGEHRVEVKSGGKVLSASITVNDIVTEANGQQIADIQDFAVTLDGDFSKGIAYYATIGSGIALIIAMVVGGVIVLQRRREFTRHFQYMNTNWNNSTNAAAGPAITGQVNTPSQSSKVDTSGTIASIEERLAKLQGASGSAGNPGQVITPQSKDQDDHKV